MDGHRKKFRVHPKPRPIELDSNVNFKQIEIEDLDEID